MKMRKVISAFLVLICICTVFCLCTLDASATEGARTVYATTNASAKQGSYGYLYVYLDDLTDLSALNVSVYYDTEKITVKSVTNKVSSVVNDLATGDGQVNASYIFDGKGTATKTNLFYIYYQVNNTAEIGDTYFDIVVNEAYNSSLEGMDFTGSRCSLEITEKTVTKSCSISSSSTVSTSVGEEFELSYRLSTYQIASGSMNIQYDPELFEVVSVTNGGFLTDKIADINTALDGTIAISFVGTTYQTKYDVVKVRFKTLKNVTETSDIKLVVTDLYDKELNLYSCSGYTTKASIAFDESYTEDAPSMSVRSSYNSATGKVTATIKLEKDSMLGAGDFVLKFDTRYLTYISAEKGFSPTFFNINDKDAAEGILKFSIISLSDITDEQVILTASFDVKHYCQDKTAGFEISGSGLTDSLVNTIPLNFVDSSIIVPLKHTAATAVVENRVEPNCTTNGSYNSVIYCSECKAELSREINTIDKLGHDHSTEWTVDVAPTCTETGIKSHHCSRCDDKADVTTIPANGHAYSDWYVITAPTCTATGTDEHKCTVCQHTETKATNALGHTESAAVVEKLVLPNCTTNGGYDSVIYCSVCDAELSRVAQTIDKLGHDYKTEWTTDLDPTCTVAGSKSHHCSRCGDKANITPIPANGHSYGDWYTIAAPTCTLAGVEEHECSVCHTKETRALAASGHIDSIPVIENRINPDCTNGGSYDSVVYCSVCKAELSRESKVIDELGHNEILHIGKAATCTEGGYKDYATCSRCNYSTYETIPALGHAEVSYDAKASTCTDIGWEAYFICSTCGYTTYEEMAALGHTYSEWIIDEEATFESNGKKHKECTVCQEILEESIIPMLKHSYISVITVPTCTERGYTTHTCSDCGNSYVDNYVPANGHTFGAWIQDKAPTCTAEGVEHKNCIVCDYFETRSVAPMGHNESRPVIKNKIEATCTVDGSYNSVVYCSVCGVEMSRENKIIVALGHNYDIEWTVDLAPTCTEKGSMSHHCTRCNLTTDLTEIPANGHINATAVVENKVSATCTSDGSYDNVIYCLICGDELSREIKVIDKIAHSYSNWSISTAATCTAIGTERRDCENCDHFETRDVAALGHDTVSHPAQSATCTDIGWNAYETCLRCNYTTYVELPSKGGHTFGEWELIIDPTPDTAGMDRRTCSVCGHYENRDVAALGYLQAFIDAVETLSNNESAENTYSELYSALQLYSKLTDDEKQEANEEFLVLQDAINAYNAKAETANTELKNATEIAFIPISASFTFLAALWFLLKKKFWIK